MNCRTAQMQRDVAGGIPLRGGRAGLVAGRRGWTLLEVLVVVGTVGILAGAILPSLPRGRVKGSRISCIANLKQIGLAMRMWSNDSGEKFPFQTSEHAVQPGTMERVATGEVWRHFAAISNEVNTPKVFVCPSDRERVGGRATDWAQFQGNGQLSYFIGLDASEVRPDSLLTGDRNLDLGRALEPVTRIARLSGETSVGWTADVHVRQGNLGRGDGSALQVDSAALRQQVQAASLSIGQPAVRVAIP